MWVLGQSVINGLLMGGVYALAAVGLTLIFGVMKIVNFAQAEFLMLGMYSTWLLVSAFECEPYAMIVPVGVIMFIIGYLIYRAMVQPIMKKEGVNRFVLLTLGLQSFLQGLVQIIMGADYRSTDSFAKGASVFLGEFSFAVPRLIAMAVVLILFACLSLVLKKSEMGRALRATAENADIAAMLGINPVSHFALAFGLGAATTGIAGLLLTPMYYTYPTIGDMFGTLTFVVVVIGGMGSVKGALLGGLLIGLIEALTASYVAMDLGTAGIFVVFVLVLVFRPQGLFGGGAREV